MDMDVLHHLDEGVLFGRLASAAGRKAETDRPFVKMVRFLGQETEVATRIFEALGARGWDVRQTQEPRTEVGSGDVVLVLDELTDDVAVHLDAAQWELLQHLIRTESCVLWATTGAQMAVEKPNRGAIKGPSRVVRAALGARFDPLAGTVVWSGRLATALPPRTRLVLTTPHGSALADATESDPWGNTRVTGMGRPPFPVELLDRASEA